MSDSRSEFHPPQKLTIGGTASQGLGGFLRNFFPFLQVMAIPLLLSLAERLAYDALLAAGLTRGAASAVWAIARAPVWTLFGFAWLSHLLGSGHVKHLWLPAWSRAHWSFMLCVLVGLVLPNYAVTQFTYQVVSTVWPDFYWSFRGTLRWIVVFIVYYLYCRSGLAFCALVAEGRKGSLRNLVWSWRRTGGAAARAMIVLLPVIWGTSTLSEWSRTLVPLTPDARDFEWLLAPLLITFFAYINFGVMMAIWAYAYRTLVAGTVPQKEILERFE